MSVQLNCIDLDQPQLEGFRKFISCWLYRGEACTFVVDPGPLSTIPALLAALKQNKVDKLDYILLTHIHIDHAGGSGELLKAYPEARVICHPDGIRHMVDPGKLWQGSKKVLGELAEAYGEIIPVAESQISYEKQLGTCGIRSFLTPGHAQHHCCYLVDDLLFAGEVVGVHCPVNDGTYMRPATPTKFILEVALDSIQKMIELQPKKMVIAHYGLVEPALKYLQIGRDQLKLWVKIVAKAINSSKENDRSWLVNQLLSEDRSFQNISQLDKDLRAREDYFLDNSLRGMRDYVAGLSEETRRQLLQETG